MRILSVMIIISIWLLAVSCSFFDPRVPQGPSQGDEIPWQQPYAPSTVVLNLIHSMEGRSISMCMSCCDSSFIFLADDVDTTQFASSWNFNNWDYEVEQNTLINIFNAVAGSGLPDDSLVSVTMNTVSEHPDPASSSDSVKIWRDYEIVAAGSEYCGWDNPAKGRAIFLMIEDNFGLWSMKRWEDYRPEEYTVEYYTWGVAKATYR